MINSAPLQLPITTEELSQEWLSWFDEAGDALTGVWIEFSGTLQVNDGTASSVQYKCVVRGTVAYLFIELNNYVNAGTSTLDSPVTFDSTFSQIRDISSGALIGLAVNGSTISLPSTDGSYEIMIHAPVVLDTKLAER